MLDNYVQLLKNGDLVAFPTETVYGLGADAKNPKAVKKVFECKGRPADNPLIVHLSSISMAEDFAKEISDDAQKLIKEFWPGPLTLIFPKKAAVLDIITGGLDTVALRWPLHPLAQELISLAGPLVAPSANSSGKPSPTKARHVKDDFGDDFPVIDAGETDIGLESTVLDVSEKPYKIYRPGAISPEQISRILGQKIEVIKKVSADTSAKSPGTKYTHYSPRADVHWMTEANDSHSKNALYIYHQGRPSQQFEHTVSYSGDYKKMGHELYDHFRQADYNGRPDIYIEPFSDDILNKNPFCLALLNRITKAIGK